MTPLFSRFCKRLVSEYQNDVWSELIGSSEVACFEVSDLVNIVEYSMENLISALSPSTLLPSNYTFLPCSVMFVEWEIAGGARRIGVLLSKFDEVNSISVRLVDNEGYPSRDLRSVSLVSWDLGDRRARLMPAEFSLAVYQYAFLFLGLINDTKITSIDYSPPHRGQVRKLARMTGADAVRNIRDVGYVRMKLSDPKHAGSEPAAIPGASKRLHFCRAHLRIVRGRQVFVRAHWRGDASKGPARQPTYKVKP